jgi:hypothetical protein
MKRLGTVVGAGVLLLLASACANQQDDQDSTAGDSRPTHSSASAPASSQPSSGAQPTGIAPGEPAPNGQPAPNPPAGGKKVDKDQLDAKALPPGYPAVVWTQDNGSTVGLVAREGGCGKASVENAETDKQVTITMIETVPKVPRPCTMDLRYPKVTTELKAPLGDRIVVLKHAVRKT